MTKQKYDIVIAGGGIVGCAAALALAKHTDYSIAIVEAFSQEMQAKVAETQNATLATSDNLATSDKNSDQVHPSFDTRVVALAQESYSQLMAFGIDMDAVVTCPIQHIHVSDRGHLGQAQLKAHNGLGSSSTKDTSMGYVVSLAEMGTQVLTQIESSRIDYFSPFKITQIQRELSSTTLSIMNTSLEEAGGEQQQDASKQPTTIETSLVIIAEGAQSPTRALFKLSHDTVSYQQSAIIANVLCQRTHQNCAFERFTSQGPIAMLPMQTESGNQMSLVWTAETENANDIMRLSDAGFLQKLQGLFGDKLGKIKASSPRHSYPLSLVKTPVFAAHRVICMGNAAQSLHPIAGQGFNLGVRDIQGLLKSLKQEEGLPADPGSFELIHSYKKHRAQDKSSVIEATDGLVRIFSNQFFPLVVGRNISLLALNHAPALKDKLASFAMGRR